MDNSLESRGRESPGSNPVDQARIGRLMGADSLFEPALSVILTAAKGAADLESTVETVGTVLEQGHTTGELIVIGSFDDPTLESLRNHDVIVVDSIGGAEHAIETAYKRARGNQVVLVTESDRYDLSDLGELLEELDSGAEMVIGSRVGDYGLPVLERHVGVPLFSTLLKWRYGIRLSDPGSGMIAFDRTHLDEIELSLSERSGLLEFVLQAKAKNLIIEEASVDYRETQNREVESTTNIAYLKNSLRALPPDLFTLPGSAIAIIGTILLTTIVFGFPVETSFGPLWNPFRATLVGGLLAIGGIQAIGLGLFAKLRLSPLGSRGDHLTAWLIKSIPTHWAFGLGIAVLLAGVVYAVYLISVWLELGVSATPAYTADLLAGVILVLGGQLAVGAVYLDSLLSTE